jgi:hypothetical protein
MNQLPHKTGLEVAGVWIATITANIIGEISQLANYLPIVRDLIGIVSILLAIAYTLYKFVKDWRGWNPRRKK